MEHVAPVPFIKRIFLLVHSAPVMHAAIHMESAATAARRRHRLTSCTSTYSTKVLGYRNAVKPGATLAVFGCVMTVLCRSSSPVDSIRCVWLVRFEALRCAINPRLIILFSVYTGLTREHAVGVVNWRVFGASRSSRTGRGTLDTRTHSLGVLPLPTYPSVLGA